MVEVEIIMPDITPMENERRWQELMKYIENLTYEDLRKNKKA